MNQRTKDKEKKEQTKSDRMLIKFEINYNLNLLEKFIDEIRIKEVNNDATSLGSRMGSLPLPPFNDSMFQKYTFSVSSFDDDEFKKIYIFYRSLDDIKFLYSNTSSIVTESKNIHTFSEDKAMPPSIGMWMYADKLAEMWNKFEENSSIVIENGNPIK